MAAFSKTNIRQMVEERLEGTSTAGNRAMSAGVFQNNVHSGKRLSAKQALAMNTGATYSYDVKVGSLQNHEATPNSALANKRIAIAPVTITVWGKLATTVQDAQREADIEAMYAACEDAAQALAEPNTMTTTAGSAATGIITGRLGDASGAGTPVVEELVEDWDAGLMEQQITAGALLDITQAVT